MVESASINKSLFILAQCVEAMSKKQARIPYRESKMTRILSLGQNKGITVMILNLAPLRSYHLDTLSSLNFANRTKKIEVKEVENETVYRVPAKQSAGVPSMTGASIHRQPLRPVAASVANIVPAAKPGDAKDGKPAKAFSVYTDKVQMKSAMQNKRLEQRKRTSLKRGSDTFTSGPSRPSKRHSGDGAPDGLSGLSTAKIEEMVQKKVEEILAARAQNESERTKDEMLLTRSNELNEEVQRRLEALEQRIEVKEDARAEGLSYLLMGKQHQARGEDSSALKMYQLAQPYFPNNEKLAGKIEVLKERLTRRTQALAPKSVVDHLAPRPRGQKRQARTRLGEEHDSDDDYDDDEYRAAHPDEALSEEEFEYSHRTKKVSSRKPAAAISRTVGRRILDSIDDQENHTPRTTHILSVINSRNVNDIKLLRGIGAKKAEAIIDRMCERDNARDAKNEHLTQIRSLAELGKLKGVGMKTVENMRNKLEL